MIKNAVLSLPTPADLVDNLVAVVTSRLLDPLEIVLDDGDLVDALRARVVLKAKGWAAEMLGDDDYVAGRAAYASSPRCTPAMSHSTRPPSGG